MLTCLSSFHVVTTDTSEVTDILYVPLSFHLIDFCLVLSIHALPLKGQKVTNTDTKQEVNLECVNFELRLSNQNMNVMITVSLGDTGGSNVGSFC
jgi:hypothetical protein